MLAIFTCSLICVVKPKPIHSEELSQRQQSNANYAIHSQGVQVSSFTIQFNHPIAICKYATSHPSCIPQGTKDSSYAQWLHLRTTILHKHTDLSGGIVRNSAPNITLTSQLSR